MTPVSILIALPPAEAKPLAGRLEGHSGLVLSSCAPDDLPAELQRGVPGVVVANAELRTAFFEAQLEERPDLILVADFGSVSDAVESIREGAFDYLSRPVSAEQLAFVVLRAANQHNLSCENARLRESLENRYRFANLTTRDAELRRVFEVAASVAATRANVLITGESGTGKTMLARALHGASERSEGPFVEVNCGALPHSLLESELFGHKKGAFTGAIADKLGRFEAAAGGSLFLDEIATAPLEVQVKLLRVLQDRAFERLGETETRTADVRLICATNADLAQAVAEGSFREDLFYRINVVRLEVPPLRERPGDVALLAHSFLERFRREYDRPVAGIHQEALAALAQCPWPGNVRQLENAIERAVLLATGPRLVRADFSMDLGSPAGPAAVPATSPSAGSRGQARDSSDGVLLDPIRFPVPSLKKALEAPEKAIIARALEVTGGSRQETARMLGVNRTTLFNKMRKYGLLDRQLDRPFDRSA